MAFYGLALTSLALPLSLALLSLVWLTSGGAQWCRLAYLTLPRDVHLLQRGLKLLLRMAYLKMKDINMVQAFRNTANAYPQRIMLVNAMTGSEWSYHKAITPS